MSTSSAHPEHHRFTNQLINEKSPYLLQHAHNPVEWYPWGTEAFEKAKSENKPIFLSVGYSTCHWCHVMEHESFENETIARLMNENFVNIKVDREERPDVDRIYMTFVQATTGSGGWPMSVFLTPDLKPIFGGTYFPATAQYRGYTTFPDLLVKISHMWKKKPEDLRQQGNEIMAALKKHTSADTKGQDILSEASVAEMYGKMYRHFSEEFDSRLGGFGGAPKFPRPVIFNFLFRLYNTMIHKSENQNLTNWHGYGSPSSIAENVLHMITFTMTQMAKGGMYDHLGGGFHRYSVDEEWHVPHFEKMLYDNGQLICSYVAAYQISKDKFYEKVVRETIEYISRDMTHKEGGIFSAEDADSLIPNTNKKAEGAFYVWEKSEIMNILKGDQNRNADMFCYVFGVEENGNVKPRSDPHGELKRKNVLIQRKSFEEAAHKFNCSKEEVSDAIARSKSVLFEYRSKTRPRPHLDDKIITSWNGLILSGFCSAFQCFGENSYLQYAKNCANFVQKYLYNSEKGILMRSFREGTSKIEGFLNDYAFWIQGLIDLYETTGEIHWLKWAEKLQIKQDELFSDSHGAGYYDDPGTDKSILLRLKEDYDGAEPSGNSIAAMNLVRLSRLLNNTQWNDRATKIFSEFGKRLKEIPFAVPQMLCAVDEFMKPAQHVMLVGDVHQVQKQILLPYVWQEFIPGKNMLYIEKNDDSESKKYLAGKHDAEWINSLKGISADNPTVYVCQNFACQLPSTDPRQVLSLLRK